MSLTWLSNANIKKKSRFHHIVQSGNHHTIATQPIKNQWRRTKKNYQKNQKKRAEIWAKPRLEKQKKKELKYEQPKSKPTDWEQPAKTQLEPQREAETHAWNTNPKCKQSPKPSLKSTPKPITKYKHKRRNPYWNRNTNTKMGQSWWLGAWVGNELRKKDGWGLAGERHTQIE